MPDEPYDVFLSHSRSDPVATADLHAQLQRHGLRVFKDDQSIQPGDSWLDQLQLILEECGSFVVLVGRDGVRRWIGAETQVALNRHFSPHDDKERLPIFPVLLDETTPEQLPPLLRLFQVTRWKPGEPLHADLLGAIRDRNIVRKFSPIPGCPFVGLAAYRPEQAHLFFGRHKETLDALATFRRQSTGPQVKWLEINGNSGSGKSSLMQAGLLPLIEQGWLWPRTGYVHWRRIGPMMPGVRPVEMLAECLARTFKAKMSEVVQQLQHHEYDLRYWLRERKEDDIAFVLVIDQFEELLTFADPEERRRFDGLLAAALQDGACPLFVISTVRADFLDRFADDLPQLANVQNRLGKTWKLAPISADGLREVIDGPARLAGLDVREVKELMVAEARDEPGALPLVENALHWLWENRTNNRLSGELFTEHGGLAGILSSGADGLLEGLDKHQRERALELLFRLIKVDPEARRHTRRRLTLAEAVAIAGGGESGRALVDRLAGQRGRDGGTEDRPLRLITVTEETSKDRSAAGECRWVNLIHETLIRSKGHDASGNPQPYWPTLWAYIERHKDRATRTERLQLLAQEWKNRSGLTRLFGLAGWSGLFRFRGLAVSGSIEQSYLRWSSGRAFMEAVILMASFALLSESVYWAIRHQLPYEAVIARWSYIVGIWTPPLPKLVEVPEGQFMMGSEADRDARPVHQVTISKPFYLGATEVTFAQYDAFLEAIGNLRDPPADQRWGRSNWPVINVSWFEARAYAEWFGAMIGASCRLPSEAEWEYACRAGSTTEYAFGRTLDTAEANFAGAVRKTTQVCSYPANNWSLYDMHGNVWEWAEDCYHETYYDRMKGQARPPASSDRCPHVLRGGSWNNNQQDVSCAKRDGIPPSQKTDKIGFRVLCSKRLDGEPCTTAHSPDAGAAYIPR